MKIKGNILFDLVLLAVCLIIVFWSLQYSLVVRFGPLVVGITAALLLLIQIVMEIIAGSKIRKAGKSSPANGKIKILKGSYAHEIIEIGSCLGGLLGGIYLFGLSLALPLFVVIYLKIYGERWPLVVTLGAITFVLIYFVFGSWLAVDLYEGILYARIFT